MAGNPSTHESADPIETLHTPLAALADTYRGIVSTLLQLGLNEQQWKQICTESIAARCEMCGTKVSGEDLGALSTVEGEGECNPRVMQLRKGYCARKGCESHFYRLEFFANPDVDWPRIKERIAQQQTSEPKDSSGLSDANAIPPISAKTKLNWHKYIDRPILIRLGLGVLAVVLLFFVYHWIYGGRIPIIQKKHHYGVMPMPK